MSRRKKKRGQLPVMILDYNMCIRVEPGDEQFAQPTVPYSCKECLTLGFQNGILRLSGADIPVCEDHLLPVQMTPVR